MSEPAETPVTGTDLVLGTLAVTGLSVGATDNDAYLLRCRASGATLLVDAAAEAERLLRLVGDLAGGRLDGVLTTHRHHDHWGALAQLVQATGTTTYAGAADADAIGVRTDVRLGHGDLVRVGEAEVRVVALPGHTPGSVAVLLEPESDAPVVLTGDALFPGGVGRTGSPEEFTSAYDAVVRELFDQLPDATRVLPGHGLPTTLGAERPSLPEWRARGW
ncbi:glyoxylase-like metal-dependent hydrolase (beta-lactamase superfamily II) [Motilibacter rhizosphaerae]|uniref:Glyoxylase-like metal-dependent hydrolase (Beta-lactamase superfamily II) n=1 Tax=Motilibacter rhizosphaerae TaxID=598652 RepID=A0A4Q7NG78_9ACTN|nr:MBL fold metallo-hydrolase [Motilibacter rhizosphaerae]RZS82825.1 glyoxylase-like metal-dependent hydrolase (beta-lactamase superfamily II) [Motilibacter rhizosphaerae]